MPGRKIPLVNGNFYHIFNRGVAKLPIFTDIQEYKRAQELIRYYRFSKVPLKYSEFIKLAKPQQEKILMKLNGKAEVLVRIHAFTFMPNHFHFILEQMMDGGISKFMSDFSNSYTKYINTKEDRVGPVLQGSFKARLIKTEEDMLHLSRYHHLNPLTDGVVKSHHELADYRFSSLPDYIGDKIHDFVYTDLIVNSFENKKKYWLFVLKQKDYQRSLARIKKLLFEKRGKSRA